MNTLEDFFIEALGAHQQAGVLPDDIQFSEETGVARFEKNMPGGRSTVLLVRREFDRLTFYGPESPNGRAISSLDEGLALVREHLKKAVA